MGNLVPLGEYRVDSGASPIIKAVYHADIIEIESKSDFMETDGPLLLEHLPDNYQTSHEYSFIMKDEVVPYSLSRLSIIKAADHG